MCWCNRIITIIDLILTLIIGATAITGNQICWSCFISWQLGRSHGGFPLYVIQTPMKSKKSILEIGNKFIRTQLAFRLVIQPLHEVLPLEVFCSNQQMVEQPPPVAADIKVLYQNMESHQNLQMVNMFLDGPSPQTSLFKIQDEVTAQLLLRDPHSLLTKGKRRRERKLRIKVPL